MIKEKEIWLGYSESPADFFDETLKFKKNRHLLITKVYKGTTLVRVTEASTKLKDKYKFIFFIKSLNYKFSSDKYSSYIIDYKNLGKNL